MSNDFTFTKGDRPLLISVPHDGREIPAEILARMTAEGRAIPDTDWHVAKLYEFVGDLGAHVLTANYSRFVVDLNRSADDDVLYPGQTVTGLCPERTFAGDAIYKMGNCDAVSERTISDEEIATRVGSHWRPYHDKIERTLRSIRAEHGYALLWDAHSIPGIVPRLFDGELPALNLGSNSGNSCDRLLEEAVANVARASSYSSVVNGRFKGGYITRHYGDPAHGVHALQLEIAQRAYMNEKTNEFDEPMADTLRATLRLLLQRFLGAAKKL